MTYNSDFSVNHLYLMVFLDILGVGLIIPVVTAIPKALQMDHVTQGLINSVYFLLQFLFNPVMGRLSDFYGRKKMFLVSIAGLWLFPFFLCPFSFSGVLFWLVLLKKPKIFFIYFSSFFISFSVLYFFLLPDEKLGFCSFSAFLCFSSLFLFCFFFLIFGFQTGSIISYFLLGTATSIWTVFVSRVIGNNK